MSYHYDALNHMATAGDSSVTLATLGYDKLGRRASVTYANGAQTLLSWSPDDDLTTMGHSFPAASGDNVSYQDAYSPAHQILSSLITGARGPQRSSMRRE